VTTKKAPPELSAVARKATELLIEVEAKKIAEKLARETMRDLKKDKEFISMLKKKMLELIKEHLEGIDYLDDIVQDKDQVVLWSQIRAICFKSLKEKLSE
jgi:hypothetical protein